MLLSRTARSQLPVRVVLFLRASGTHPGIRRALRTGGFAEDDHAEGFRLLAHVCAWSEDGLDATQDALAREARERCVAFVNDHFPRLRAAVSRKHPEHDDLFTFRGAAADDNLLALTAWLRRLDGLEEDARGSAVLDTLGKRGVDRARRAELADDLAVATAAPTPRGTRKRNRDADIAALYRWYVDWAATARALIQRKDWLVTLGLRGLRRRSDVPDEPDEFERTGTGARVESAAPTV